MNHTTLSIKNILTTVGECLSQLVAQDGSPRISKNCGGTPLSENQITLLHSGLCRIGSASISELVVTALANVDFVKDLLFIEATRQDGSADECVRLACTECSIREDVGFGAYRALCGNTLADAVRNASTTSSPIVLGEKVDEHVLGSIRTVLYASNRILLGDRPTGVPVTCHDFLDRICRLLQKAHECKPAFRSHILHTGSSVMQEFDVDLSRKNAFNVAVKKVRRLVLTEWYNTGYYPPTGLERHHLGRYLATALHNVTRPGDGRHNDAGYVMFVLDFLRRIANHVTLYPGMSSVPRANILDIATQLSNSIGLLRDRGMEPSIILFNRYGRGSEPIVLAADIGTQCLSTVEKIKDGLLHYDDDGTITTTTEVVGSEFGATGIVEKVGNSTVHTGRFRTDESRTMGALFEQAPECESSGAEVTFTSLFKGDGS
jgi:hypothetical protein